MDLLTKLCSSNCIISLKAVCSLKGGSTEGTHLKSLYRITQIWSFCSLFSSPSENYSSNSATFAPSTAGQWGQVHFYLSGSKPSIKILFFGLRGDGDCIAFRIKTLRRANRGRSRCLVHLQSKGKVPLNISNWYSAEPPYFKLSFPILCRWQDLTSG